MSLPAPSHATWSNRLAYILAATGAAVGLGNIWKFPYMMGENGGAAFLLIYLGCVLAIGIPVMMAEVLLGKTGRRSPGAAVAEIARQSGRSAHWGAIGWMGVVAGFLILSFYAVIAGWALAYVFYAGDGQFVVAEGQVARDVMGELLSGLTSDPWAMVGWTSAVMLATVVTVALGVQKGLETTVKYAMPTLFIMLLALAGYALLTSDGAAALKFMFAPDFSKISVDTVVMALGQAFFSLSLASGVVMMYGAYLPEGTSIARTSLAIALADTTVALTAGMAIFPVVFGNGLPIDKGPDLVFLTLPIAFSQMPGGTYFGIAFFVILVFAAFTSAIALIESSVAYLVERFALRRWQAAGLAGFAIWLLSLGSVASFAGHDWAKFSWQWHGQTVTKNFFNLIDFLTANVMLPLGGLLICIFVGYLMAPALRDGHLGLRPSLRPVWLWLVRIFCPLAIAAVFLSLIGIGR